MSLKQIQIITHQITKEFIMEEKLTKVGMGFLYILGMIFVFLVVTEKFLQLNYSEIT